MGAGGGEGITLIRTEEVAGETHPSALVTLNVKIPGGKPVKV